MRTIENSQTVNASGFAKVTVGPVHQEVNSTQNTSDSGPDSVSVGFLFVAANPEDTSRLRLDREVRGIETALQVPTGNSKFKVTQLWAAEIGDLQNALLRVQPELVHLSGHGTRSSGFLFEDSPRHSSRGEDETPGERERNLKALVHLFAAAKSRVRCVVVNSCHSVMLAEELSKEVDVAIGMDFNVEDHLAARFSSSFYSALAVGVDVKRAYRMAAAQLALAGNHGGEPQLFSARTDPGGIVFGEDG